MVSLLEGLVDNNFLLDLPQLDLHHRGDEFSEQKWDYQNFRRIKPKDGYIFQSSNGVVGSLAISRNGQKCSIANEHKAIKRNLISI